MVTTQRFSNYHFGSSDCYVIGGVKVDGDEDSWDFGTGAGFYVDATEDKWKKHYRMYSYIVKELPAIIYQSMPIVS
jgi:S-formylglutathione hydrolase